VTARPHDDDALSWGDEDDPTLHVGSSPAAEPEPAPEPAEPPVLPDGFTPVGKGAESVAAGEAAASVSPQDHEAPGLGNAAVLVIGILGGVYLLATIGWIVGGLRLRSAADYLVAPVAYQVSLWLAVAAPALWFGTVFWLTARARTWVRLAWLIGGAALLLPWPFIMVGAVGR
jgi:hypothetical protein